MKSPWSRCERIDDGSFRTIRLRTIFECHKWDPQVEDSPSLSPWAVVLEEESWLEIAALAEALALELIEAERELRSRPELWRRLGLDSSLRGALERGREIATSQHTRSEAMRHVRFDFHFTTEGWRISEANSDVPGGFIEASGFTRLVADHLGDVALVGDPSAALADAFARSVPAGGIVALVHATAFTDDRQVMVHLGRALENRGLRTLLVGPDCIDWSAEPPRVTLGDRREPVDAILRFFPAEWLPNLGRGTRWQCWFLDLVPMSNPPSALLTQSKRFPLVWPLLETPLPTWRACLPETSVVTRRRRTDPDWVLKPALGRVGQSIGLAGVTTAKDWSAIRRASRRRPRRWIAQRRFETLPIETDEGPLYPCVGVFVVGGRASGAYGRASVTPLIDERATDVAVLAKRTSRRDGAQLGSVMEESLARSRAV